MPTVSKNKFCTRDKGVEFKKMRKSGKDLGERIVWKGGRIKVERRKDKSGKEEGYGGKEDGWSGKIRVERRKDK